MVSIPDKLQERLDRHVGEIGETRSGFIQRVVEREIEIGDVRRRKKLEKLMSPVRMGGDTARLLRESRDSR
jgi:metal-responsive CopG/Arc/MetJ family transcriptional regulator